MAARTLEGEKHAHLAPRISRGHIFLEVYLQSRSTPCLPDALLTKQTSCFCPSFVTHELKCLSDNLRFFWKSCKNKSHYGVSAQALYPCVPCIPICYVLICRVDETYATQPINYLCTGYYCASKKFYSFTIHTCFIIICALDGTIQLVLSH